jgi:hypothetical protein
MAIPKLQVQITADTKQAEDGLKKVSGEIGGVDNASRKAMSAVKAFAAGLVSIAAVGTVFSKSVNLKPQCFGYKPSSRRRAERLDELRRICAALRKT